MAVIDEDGTQQLHITEVKAGGLASAKGTYLFFNHIPDMKCVMYCTFSILRVDIQTQKTKQSKRDKNKNP